VQVFAVGAMTGGLAAGTLAFDKRAGQHFAKSPEAADEFAAQFQVGFVGGFHMTCIVVSEMHKVKYLKKFARMPSNCNWNGKACQQTGLR